MTRKAKLWRVELMALVEGSQARADRIVDDLADFIAQDHVGFSVVIRKPADPKTGLALPPKRKRKPA